jgi:hypothetical protein
VQARHLLATLVLVLAVVAFVGAAATATAGRTCVTATRAGGYSYAGHQAASRGHGIRATITLTRAPSVAAGHVAGWVGVGGQRQGANGGDAWLQAGIAALRGLGTVLYAEITREGRDRKLVLVDDSVRVGRAYRIAVRAVAGRSGWWQVWVDGEAVTEQIRMPGRWAPIATAESWNGGTSACNDFAFRFDRVAVAGEEGSWRPFVSGHRFLDGTHRLRGHPAAFVASSS